LPTIDFYLIAGQTNNERLRFACRLIDKAYTQQHRVYVQVTDAATAHTMNDLLWIFRDVSFVPHDLDGGEFATKSPVVIGFRDNPNDHSDILVNLDTQIPKFFTDFERVVEIVHADKTLQQAMRNNYRYYRDQGLAIQTHDLRATTN
jgi:DNA polymerase-3 subunit chi